MTVLCVVLGVATLFCAVKWLVWYAVSKSLTSYMENRNCPPPSRDELMEGVKRWAACLAKDLISGKARR